VRETGINYWFTVPTVLKALKKSGRLGQPELGSIQHLVLTGEPVPADLVNEWRRHYPHCAVYNFYGTTETVIISHWYKVEGELPEGAITPVGRPVPGVRIRLMDKGRPVEPGTPGESVVWGSQISPGYWRNAAENTTRFVEGLIDPALPQKAFRTGDLLRLREDGLYEYLGRLDRQVKVRGHRVELLEVEKAIMRVPGVEEVAVVACENARASMRLTLWPCCTSRRALRRTPAGFPRISPARIHDPLLVPDGFCAVAAQRQRQDRLPVHQEPDPGRRRPDGGKMNSDLRGTVRAAIIGVFKLDPAALPAELSADTVEKWDSLGHLNLVMTLEKNLSVRIPYERIPSMINEDAIVEVLQGLL
jgi:acyl-CoA synthetase (AMP-forming)/AMP-acid ligase II/acyl carrier protein